MKILKTLILILMTAAFLYACGGGGGGGGGGVNGGGTTTIAGTAATGAPIGSATVTIKDKNGNTKTGATDVEGKYTIDVTGMTTPFLLKVPSGATNLYSVATEDGTANIHPFTDLIIRNWYKVKGTDVDTAFGGSGAIPNPPTTAEIETIESVVRQILATYLRGADIDPADFNLITTPFDASGKGFDLVLDNVKVHYAEGQIVVTPFGGGDSKILETDEATDLTTLPLPPPPVSDTEVPTTPSGLAATRLSSTQVVLSWNVPTDNTGVAGYRIYRGGTQTGIIDQPFYIDGTAPAASACYTVSVYDAAGNVSGQSSQTCASDTAGTADVTPPSAPTLTATVASSSQVDLSWTASTDNVAVAGYRVMVNGVSITTTTSISFSHTGLSANTQYSYAVTALDTSGNTALSNTVSATTTIPSDTTKPSAPTGLTATVVSSGRIDLSWTASTDNVGVTGYYVYAGGTNAGTSSTASFSHTNLTPSTQYCYTVKAYDAAGNLSNASSEVCATTSAANRWDEMVWDTGVWGD